MMKSTNKSNAISPAANTVFNMLFMAFALLCMIPIVIAVSISLTSEASIIRNGYSLFPAEFSLEAYSFIFKDGSTVITAYLVTIGVTVVGSLSSLLVIALFAYPLSRRTLKYKRFFTMYIFITMLFSGGLVPWYIVCSQILRINNTYFALFLPILFNAWYVIIMRTFFQTTVPDAVIESAKIDGAGELTIFFRIVTPMSKAGYATIGLFCTLGFWNDWWLSMILTTDAKYRTLQYFIYKVLTDSTIIQQMQYKIGANAADVTASLPMENARFAMCILAMGPVLFVYPFFQKYFIKGLTVGAVKG